MKLGGGVYSSKEQRDHFCRIAKTSIPDCRYWAEKYTNNKDLASILADEAVEDEDEDSVASLSSSESDCPEDNAPLVQGRRKRNRRML